MPGHIKPLSPNYVEFDIITDGVSCGFDSMAPAVIKAMLQKQQLNWQKFTILLNTYKALYPQHIPHEIQQLSTEEQFDYLLNYVPPDVFLRSLSTSMRQLSSLTVKQQPGVYVGANADVTEGTSAREMSARSEIDETHIAALSTILGLKTTVSSATLPQGVRLTYNQQGSVPVHLVHTGSHYKSVIKDPNGALQQYFETPKATYVTGLTSAPQKRDVANPSHQEVMRAIKTEIQSLEKRYDHAISQFADFGDAALLSALVTASKLKSVQSFGQLSGYFQERSSGRYASDELGQAFANAKAGKSVGQLSGSARAEMIHLLGLQAKYNDGFMSELEHKMKIQASVQPGSSPHALLSQRDSSCAAEVGSTSATSGIPLTRMGKVN